MGFNIDSADEGVPMGEIRVKNLKKIYGKGENRVVALNGASFEIQKGELTVILGPSGSGKSTLLNILGGMDTATEGSVMVGKKMITALNEKQLTKYRRDDIGFVFQFYNLMPNLTALENVQLSESKTGFKARDVLELVGLKHRLNNFPSQLSGGEQQRVAIARAIVKAPKLLLCDEPTGALDSVTGRTIIELLNNLSKEKQQTIIIVTHNSNLAQAAKRVIRLSDGKIIENTVTDMPKNPSEIEW